MDTKLYKVYSASQYDSLDLSLFYPNIRWSNDRSEVILEFINTPHGNTITLTESEAVDLMSDEKWMVNFLES